MTNIFESLLGGIAKIQKKHSLLVLIITLIFTVIMIFGAVKMEFQGDLNKEMPQDLPIYQLNDKISDNFGGQDTILILLMLDDSLDNKALYDDIRSPEILTYIKNLHNSLIHESMVDNVYSAGLVIESMESMGIPVTLENIKAVFNSNSELSNFVSEDNKISIIMVQADVGSGQDKVTQLTNLIENKINALSSPSGVRIQVTGTPSILNTILNLLKHDSVYTLIIASVIIFLLLFIIQKSFTKSILVFLPLIFGLIWTIGTMGFLNLKISVATAGLGAMILGLGVEYGVFMLTRYNEERIKGKNQYDSIIVAVPSVGSAVLGSGMTTIVGFLALTLSIMPMLQHLGQSLALGIFYCIVASVFVEPSLIILEEKFEYWHSHKTHLKLSKKVKKHKESSL